MLVFIDTAYGSTFCIEVNLNDKVLDIKNKIEASQGIPVSMQTLYYNGEPLLVDDLDLSTCNIVTNSRVFLVLSYQEDNNDQVLQPTSEQSLAPSTLGEFQDWTATARSIFREMLDQREQSLTRSAMMGRHDKNQDLLQSEPSSTSNTFEEDLPLLQPTEQSLAPSTSVQDSLELFSSIQSHWPASTTTEKGIDNSNVLQTEQSTIPSNEVEALDNQVWSAVMASTAEGRHHTNQDSTSNTFGDLLFGDDLPLSTEHFSNIQTHWPASTTEDILVNKEQLFQTEQPLVPSNSTQVVQTQKPTRSIREVINIPDSPESTSNKRAKNLFRVMVLSFPVNDTPARKFPVEVNPSENVEVLRTELAKMQQRAQLLLPEGGYFFIHKTQLLNEKQSFRWNRVAQGDTIEIFPGSVTVDQRTNTRG
ncbi:hypothetical protein Bca4012_019611 [Brassica carinata]